MPREAETLPGRGVCAVEGCVKLVMKKDQRGGRQRYRLLCSGHYFRRIGVRGNGSRYLRIDKETCSRCGWSGSCHSHRVVPSEGYTKANVLVLCPNCHNAVHGRGEWNQKQVYDSVGIS